ncbi:MAG TPA: SDR family oxidoreductase [Dehalococcoidia bacterium]|nr:SDR family oxidoreductase [Dehalococcoidia bacterium]
MPSESLQGQCVLVTGATQPVGRAIAAAVAADGANVVVAGRVSDEIGREALHTVLAEIRSLGAEAMAAELGEPDEEQIAACQTAIDERWGGLDVLINTAELSDWSGPSWEMPTDEWDSVFSTNVHSALLLCRQFLPGMMERARGAIVNIGGWRWATPGLAAFGASKASLDYLTMALAGEVRAFNIAVNSVSPSQGIDYPGSPHWRQQPGVPTAPEPPEHFALAVVWLAKQDAESCTGNLTWSRQITSRNGLCRSWCCKPAQIVGPWRVAGRGHFPMNSAPQRISLGVARDD